MSLMRLMIKVGSSIYRGGSRQWQKLCHTETVEAPAAGCTGPPMRPRHPAVRLPDGSVVPSQRR
ncbi:hypothetical protein [Streptomyces griseosporeus]|uniref:hypothetical protein n=1 Tax=Streptomyces griseosporeus TaxID=1910 RepID=UPI0036FE6DD0